MKKARLLSIFIIFSSLVLAGCTTLPCKSKLYTEEGECCTYVCDKECSNGYVEGTCHCECVEGDNPDNGDDTYSGGDDDLNIDDIFGNDDDIVPPPIPN